jgi:hypothetical protein
LSLSKHRTVRKEVFTAVLAAIVQANSVGDNSRAKDYMPKMAKVGIDMGDGCIGDDDYETYE